MGELEDTVWEFPVGMSTSHLHGCVCGLLCANTHADHETLLSTLVDLLEPEAPGIDAGAGLNELDRFSGLTRLELEADDFGFKPLLSEDDAPLAVRLADLADSHAEFELFDVVEHLRMAVLLLHTEAPDAGA